jgi:predicted alpha/beta hydrolase family esterase
MKESVLICENWDGRSDKQWLFWLKKKLEQVGFEVNVFKMPQTGISMKAWLPELQHTYGIKGDNVHLVKTDPGCITLYNYIKRIARNQEAEPAMLVAGQPKKGPAPTGEYRIIPKAVAYKLLPNSMQVVKTVKDIVTKSEDEIDNLENLDVKLIVMYSGRVPATLAAPNPKLLFS